MSNYRHYDSIDLTHRSLREVKSTIELAIEQYGEENVKFDVYRQEEEYSDYVSAGCQLKCYRPSTQKEIDKEAEQQAYIQASRRAAYEQLKKEFG